LPLLAGDDLTGPDRRRVERHLIVCPNCRGRYSALERALGALHEAAAVDPLGGSEVAPLWPELARQIRESRRPAPEGWGWGWGWPAAAIGLAASLMVAVGIVVVARPFGSRPSSARLSVAQRPRPALPRAEAPSESSEPSTPETALENPPEKVLAQRSGSQSQANTGAAESQPTH
jgi:anti-sigma factor RsiW